MENFRVHRDDTPASVFEIRPDAVVAAFTFPRLPLHKSIDPDRSFMLNRTKYFVAGLLLTNDRLWFVHGLDPTTRDYAYRLVSENQAKRMLARCHGHPPFPPHMPTLADRYVRFIESARRFFKAVSRIGCEDGPPPPGADSPRYPAEILESSAHSALLDLVGTWRAMGCVSGWAKVPELTELLTGLEWFARTLIGVAAKSGYKCLQVGQGDEVRVVFAISDDPSSYLLFSWASETTVARDDDFPLVLITQVELEDMEAAIEMLPPRLCVEQAGEENGEVDLDRGRKDSPARQRLEVNVQGESSTIVLDGVSYPVTRANAIFVDALVRANGSRVSLAEVVRAHDEIEGTNVARELDKLPDPVARLIDRKKGVPARLRIEGLQ